MKSPIEFGLDINLGKSLKVLKAFYKNLYVDQHVPFCIERISDKTILFMNNDFKTYSFFYLPEKVPRFKWGPSYKWSYQELFSDPRTDDGDFKVISWAPIENLFNHPKKYFTKESQNTVNYRVELTKITKNNKKIDKSIKK